MKLKIFLILFTLPLFLKAQIDYNQYFKNSTLRFDFLLGGNQKNVVVYPEQIKAEPHWAGTKTNLTDPFNYGSYRYRVFDSESDILIFSKGFCTLFQEWQTTAEAKTTNKTYYQAVFFPFPKNKVKLLIDARQWDGSFKEIFQTEIDPKDYFINREEPEKFEFEKIIDNGKPENKVDIAILAEGYTEYEMDDFIEDARRLINLLFEVTPFKEEKNSFNVYAVKTPSMESGTDIPGEHIYKNTAFNSSYYTFDLDRYLTTSDLKNIYEAAAEVPWDQIYILVNSERYGGGGVYNLITVCTSGHELSPKVFVHEFGHGFAGLADEYYSSAVAYEDFYNTEIEPWEPNLTTLVNFDSKWKNLVTDSIPVPTPRKNRYKNSVGVFEGGGYMEKGIYSPMMDCRMKSNETDDFCPACKNAIIKMIEYYTK
ncbi:MAG: peptidase M64 [Prolixibacteraceae bacterium]|nr:peptidase M64 [Prolixibacteraceae bacterium]